MKNDTPPKRTQARRSAESKKKIMRAANRMFGENGFHGTRMADIAEAAGLTGPGLLHHYPNKEHLLIDVLQTRDRADHQYFETLFKDKEGIQALDALQALVEYNQGVPEMVRLFTVLVTESIEQNHPGHEFFIKRYRFFRRQYKDLLKEAQQQGRIRKDINIEEISNLVMAVMDGLQIQWLLDPEQVDMATSFKLFTQILDQGLQEKAGGSVEER